MAEVVLSLDDIIQQYMNNVVVYKGKLVKVVDVKGDKTVKIKDLESQKQAVVGFNLKDFRPPKERLGMVNVADSVIHLSRIPVRKMEIGLNGKNLKMTYLGCPYPQGLRETQTMLKGYDLPEVADTYFNRYPVFPKAFKKAIDSQGTCAFDRQFAVDFNGNIYYKQMAVGTVPLKAKNVNDIVFSDKFKYLSILLDGNHEKTIGITCKA